MFWVIYSGLIVMLRLGKPHKVIVLVSGWPFFPHFCPLQYLVTAFVILDDAWEIIVMTYCLYQGLLEGITSFGWLWLLVPKRRLCTYSKHTADIFGWIVIWFKEKLELDM